MEVEERRWERVIEVADRLLRLNPQMTDVQFHRAAANFNLGNVAMAEELALNIQSGKDAEKFPQTHHLLGMIYAKNGEWVRAATEYRNYLNAQPLGPAAKELSQDFRFGSSDGTSLHPHPAKRNHFSTRKRRRLRRDRSSPLLAPHGG